MEPRADLSGEEKTARTKGEETRDRILGAATELIAQHGYAAVTMREIGDAAGLDNSSIYRHFKSKEELAECVIGRVVADLSFIVADLKKADRPSLDALIKASCRFSEWLWDRPSAARLLLAWMSTTGQERSGFAYTLNVAENEDHPASQNVADLLHWFDEAASLGVIRPVSALNALTNLLAVIVFRPATSGFFLQSLEEHIPQNARRHDAIEELRAMIKGAFDPQAENRK